MVKGYVPMAGKLIAEDILLQAHFYDLPSPRFVLVSFMSEGLSVKALARQAASAQEGYWPKLEPDQGKRSRAG